MKTGVAMTDPVSARDDDLIAIFLDAIWMQHGLSDNTLIAYRHDLRGLAGWLARQHVSLLEAEPDHLQHFLSLSLIHI